jgi:hypothetical protein
MPELNLPTADNTVAQLFRASQYSLDPATADFMLRRVVPVTIYIDGDDDGLTNVANDLRNDIARIMGEMGYPEVGKWGPFSGSFLTTIFGQGRDPESGWSVLRRIQDLKDKLLLLQSRVPPAAGRGIRVVMVVGAFVIHYMGYGVVAAALPVTIPIVAIEFVALAVGAGECIEAIRHLLKLPPFFPRQGDHNF